MTDLTTKLNTAIAVLGDVKKSLEKLKAAKMYEACCRAANSLEMLESYKESVGEYKLSKEDSKESIIRRLVVVRGMLNEINRELKGAK
jgi:hypothetical protein